MFRKKKNIENKRRDKKNLDFLLHEIFKKILIFNYMTFLKRYL